MAGYTTNIEKKTLQNENFREVLYTAPHSQLVVMTLLPNEEIGEEIHDDGDQFFRVEQGEGKAVLNGEEYLLSDGVVIIIPAGVTHNIINTSADNSLRLYTIYSPAHHKDGTVHKTKEDALLDEEDHL